MTKEGRLARGEENFKRQRFLNNPETITYASTLKKETPKKVEEAKDAKPAK